MKATIQIEYTAENYDKVHAVLGLLQLESERYDAAFHGDTKIRVVKGRPIGEHNGTN